MNQDLSLLDYVCCPFCKNNKRLLSEEGVVRCDICNKSFPIKDGKVFFLATDKKPRTNEVKKNTKKDWTVFRRANYVFYKDEIKKIKERRSIQKLLDVGVGPGQFHDLLEKIPLVQGIDFEPYTKASVVADLSKPMPIQSNSFDTIIASNVFEHMPDPSITIAECARILSPGGSMLASTPFLLMTHQKPYDFYRYTEFSLERLCRQAGFSQVKIIPLGQSIDVLTTTHFHFMKELFNFHATIKSQPRRSVFYVAIKIASLVSKIWLSLLRIVSRNIPQNHDYTLGYGIIAEK